MKPGKLRTFDLTVSHLSSPFTTVQAHLDPQWRDIVINGYGVKYKQAKALRDWLTQALRYANRDASPKASRRES